MVTSPTPSSSNKTLFECVRSLFKNDASAGMLLIIVAAAAMLAANSPYAYEYKQLFYGHLPWTPIKKLDDLHLWINDGLMVIFFFIVGLEVKRETVSGSLAKASVRRLPMVAALAGMVTPALVYIAVSGGGEYTRGWAIPAATDIAFAMGILGLLGSRVPASLRLFLLTVAIVDDIGAILVIAVFYTEVDSLSYFLMWLAASVAVLLAMFGLNRARVGVFWPYIALAVALWYCVLNTGIHATIAGVLAALTIPMQRPNGEPMLDRLEHGLAPWSAFLVVPIFGFANAGVSFEGMSLANLFDPLPIAIATGLVLGKQVGIFTTVFAADKLGFAARPAGAGWTEIWGVSVLCGIGFTMSLFIGGLAFPNLPVLKEEAKIGILMGSAVSAVLGYAILALATKRPPSLGEDLSSAPKPA